MTNKNYLLHTLILAGIISGCAKERPFEETFKGGGVGPVTNIAAVNTEAEFLYVPTSQGVPRFSKAMSPFVQGTERIVKFKFEEDAIVAYQMEKDPSFTDNKLNNKPILKIPVEYKSYRCVENDNDECTNKEEENTELEWYQKDHFIADYGSTEVLESDTLDLPDSSDSCFAHTGDKLVKESLEVTKTDINYIVEKSYKYSNSSACMNQLWYSSNGYNDFLKQLDKTGGTFKTQVAYSFARLDSIASPGYKPVAYPLEDHGIFGFFTTSEEVKTADRRYKDEYLMNRWNPDNKVVDYYLSDEFNKPENKYLKDASFFAFERMNQALQRDGVNLYLNLKEPAGKNPGNLRNTMIVLIEDIASGLLGYGPSVANPRTGEIVKAHTNMYKGSLESFAPYTYDSIVFLEKELEKQRNARPVPSQENMKSGIRNVKDHLASVGNIFEIMNLLGREAKDSHEGHESHSHTKSFKNERLTIASASGKSNLTFAQAMKNSKSLRFEKKTAKKLLAQMKDKESDFSKFIEMSESKRDYLERNYVYTTDMVNLQALGKASVSEINEVKDIRDENGILKEWVHLTEKQKIKLTQILARHAYIPTLVHEIGHNLGLRHNFSGSTDKANFYNESERAELGIKEGSAYSSIMDYSYSQLNELSTLGKYDTAALKFAYNREVEGTDGKFYKLEEVDGGKVTQKSVSEVSGLKTYKFCTDEDAGTTLLCNRFDEGTTSLEVMKHFADKYNEDYYFRNIKNRSTNFNDTDGTWSYLIGKYYSMTDVRQIHEQWQSIFSWSRKAPGFENLAVTGCTPEQFATYGDYCNYVKETNAANSIAGRFFIDILKTPDLTCDVRISAKFGESDLIQGASVPVVFSQAVREMAFPLDNGAGKYVANSCFDKNAKIQLKNSTLSQYRAAIVNICSQATEGDPKCSSNALKITVDVVGETGKLHNDVDSVGRVGYRNNTGDLEIRGNYIDKLIASWFLTSKELMTVAGGNNNVSFVDSPEFAEEIDNLMRHLTYGEDLIDQRVFIQENGMEYIGPLKVDLNADTNVVRMKQSINSLFSTPDNSEGYKIGPVIVANARNMSYVQRLNAKNEDEYIEANRFYESLNIHRKSLDFSSGDFGTNIVQSYSTKKFTYGATQENTIALELLMRLNGAQEQEGKKITEILAKIDVEKPLSDEDITNEAPLASVASLEKVTSVKEAYNTSMSDVNGILTILSSSKDIDGDIAKLVKELGVIRFNNAVQIYQQLGSLEGAEQELMQVNLMDLRYYTLAAKEKLEYKNNLANSLFNLAK